MEVVITIALLIVPILSLISLFLSIKNQRQARAIKGLVMDLSKLVSRPPTQQIDPVEQAMNNYRINGI